MFSISPIVFKCVISRNLKIFRISPIQIPATEAVRSQREAFAAWAMLAGSELTFLPPASQQASPRHLQTPFPFRRETYFRRTPIQPGKGKIPAQN